MPQNEHICATALYYYDSHNITPSHLAFRQFINDKLVRHGIFYEQENHRWLPEIFGCDLEGPPFQDLGAVETKEGRLLTFPNTLQHQVQPFRLDDPTKPGHRKILALFLVDPHIKVISTAHVPCQRLDWWREAIDEKNTRLEKFPLELQEAIYDDVDFPMTIKAAKELRLELMEERKDFVAARDQFFSEVTFSLCEH